MSQGTGRVRDVTFCVRGVGQVFFIPNSENKARKLFTVLFTIKFLVKNRNLKTVACFPVASPIYQMEVTG